MSEKNIQEVMERTVRNEERIINLNKRMDGFETECEKTKDKVFGRLDQFLNHTVTRLEFEIGEAKKMRRQPLGRREWVAIITTSILAVANILASVIQHFW